VNIPREFIELVLAKIDIVDLINTSLPLRKKSGNNYFACCPFHNEKSASFSVSQPKQFYYCFGCGAHGNAIDFLMQHERLAFPEAIEALARIVGMEIPQTGQTTVKKEDSLPVLFDLVSQVATYYYEQMRKSPRAIDYLKKRGISGAIAQQFQLGYALPSFNQLIPEFGKTEKEKKHLLDAGLIIKKNEGGDYDRFRDRIIFPIHDHRGRIIGFGGRILDQGEPKYLNSPETPLFQKGHELYGLHQALKANRKLERVIIVEGYMDVIALFQEGITYAVATLGTATTPYHLERLFRYTTQLIFCFDGDAAGRTAAWRALQVLLPLMQDHIQVRFLFLPDGEDPDSLIRKEGKLNFENRISSALSFSTFFFQTLAKETDMNSMEGRAHFASSALQHIKQLPQGLLQTVLTDELSKRARIDVNELKKPETNSVPAYRKETLKIKLPGPIRRVAALLVQYPHLINLLQGPLPPSDLPGYSFLKRLIESLQKNPSLNTGALMEQWRGQEEETLIAKLAQLEHTLPETGIDKGFLGSIRQLSLLNFDEKINCLLTKATQLGLSEEEKSQLSTWIAEKKNFASENP
jgi:DNA primase